MSEQLLEGPIQPIHVFITLLVSVFGVLTFLWRITRSLANMEMKMGMMWRDYQKRYKIHYGEDED